MRRLLAALVWLSVVGVTACSSGGGADPQPSTPTSPGGGSASTEVAINGDAYLPSGTAVFSPDALTIDRGTTVTWKNNDQTTHTTTANGGLWGGSVAAGGSFSQAFTAAGTYEYHCTIHPYMTGTVIVR